MRDIIVKCKFIFWINWSKYPPQYNGFNIVSKCLIKNNFKNYVWDSNKNSNTTKIYFICG